MRISQSFLNNMVRLNSTRASEAVVKASAQLSALSAVEKRSDDPVSAQRLSRLDQADAQLDRFANNRGLVETDLRAADSVLGNMHEMMVRAKEIALSMSGDNVNAEDRANGARAAEGVLAQILALANQSYDGDKYLFTGLAENRPPFSAAGVFQGNDGARFVEVGPGAKVEATLRGSTVFGDNNEVVTSVQDLITALKNNDSDAVRGLLEDLDASRQTVSLARTEVGARLNQLSEIGNVSNDLRTNIRLEQGNLTGIDVAKLAPELSAAQTMLQTVVETSKQLMAQVGHAWMK